MIPTKHEIEEIRQVAQKAAAGIGGFSVLSSSKVLDLFDYIDNLTANSEMTDEYTADLETALADQEREIERLKDEVADLEDELRVLTEEAA